MPSNWASAAICSCLRDQLSCWSRAAISTLLQALGARCRHQCRSQRGANVPTVERLTEPSAFPQRALELVRPSPEEDSSRSS